MLTPFILRKINSRLACPGRASQIVNAGQSLGGEGGDNLREEMKAGHSKQRE